MFKANSIYINEYGKINNLIFGETDLIEPKSNEVQIKQTSIGVNFLDIYHRTGNHFNNLSLPAILGVEAVGIIEKKGSQVSNFNIGDKIVYPLAPGAYCTHRNIASILCVKIEIPIEDNLIAASFMKGLTVSHLLLDLIQLKNKNTILIHAAAGGVGLIACQWAKHLGATVIGTVGSEEKAAIAKQNGCDYVINYEKDNIEKNIIEITNGILCDAVIDGIGKKTWEQSIKCVRPYGKCITFGLASGPLPNIQFEDIPVGKYITRGTVGTVINDEQLLEKNSKRYFKAINDFIIKPKIYKEIKLENAREAHEILEKRVNIGSIVLKP